MNILNDERVLIRTKSQIVEEMLSEKYIFARAIEICNRYADLWDKQKNDGDSLL